jgi:formylglycine-generating enzyme required for sulfatase activity
VHAPVGTFAPNPFGLHEVHGNVWEWCLDGYDAAFYSRGASADPVFPTSDAPHRMLRGGGHSHTAAAARSSQRLFAPPQTALASIGVRPARALED